MIKTRAKIIQRAVIASIMVAISGASSGAVFSRPLPAPQDGQDDKSYSTVIKHIKSNYNAKGQSFLGMVGFARFLVKVIRPAGVKNFKLTLLREVDYSRGPKPDSPDFHAFVRETIHPSWEPLIQYGSRKEKQWCYVYFTREKDDAKILLLAMHEREAFVLQFKFNPEKLVAFINDPKIMGISMKGDEGNNPPPPGPDADRDKPTPPVSKKPESN
jgi:hypothetical protein